MPRSFMIASRLRAAAAPRAATFARIFCSSLRSSASRAFAARRSRVGEAAHVPELLDALEGVDVLLVERGILDAHDGETAREFGFVPERLVHRPAVQVVALRLRARDDREMVFRGVVAGDRAERVLAPEERESSRDEVGDDRVLIALERAKLLVDVEDAGADGVPVLEDDDLGRGRRAGNRVDGPEPRERLRQRHRDGRRATAAGRSARQGEAEPRRAREPQKRAGRSHSVSWDHGGAPSRNALK